MTKVSFTAPRVNDYKCDDGKDQSILWDTGAPGLGLRATANGSKAYIFQAKINGKEPRITIGDPVTWRLQDAREKARLYKVMVDNGQNPRDVIAAELAIYQAERDAQTQLSAKQNLIARTVWDSYLAAPHPKWGAQHRADHVIAANEGGSDCKIGSKKSKAGPLASLLCKPIHEITALIVQDWLTTECKTRATTAHNAYRKFRTFIRWCTKHHDYKQLVHADCCLADSVKEILPRNKTKANDSLQREQLTSWFASVRNIDNSILSAYLQGLLFTGARRTELAELRWADVDFQWCKMTIGDKVEGRRTIPLTPYLSNLLAALPHSNDWVFSSTSAASGHIEAPTKAHAKALVAAELPHVSLHGLRRSFGTLAEWVEVPAGVAAQIMGHKPSAIAEKHYIQRPIDILRMWHVKIEAWILEQAGIKWKPSE